MKPLWEVNKSTLHIYPHLGQQRAWDSDRRFTWMLAGTQAGKALAVSTPVWTDKGMQMMGELAVGDRVYGADGHLYGVTHCSPIYHDHQCYRVILDDGAEIVTDAEHLWAVQSHRFRKNIARRAVTPDPSWAIRPQCQRRHPDTIVLTTQEIAANIKDNYSIPVPAAIDAQSATLPIPPYTFGAWIGDGNSNGAIITSADEEVITAIEADGINVTKMAHWQNSCGAASQYRVGDANGKGSRNWFTAALKTLGVLNNKHIPSLYLFGSIVQRTALLQGLMDTDGYCNDKGHIEFCSVNKGLSDDVLLLVRSLGIKARLRIGTAKLNGRDCGEKYRVVWMGNYPCFRLPRKADRLKPVVKENTHRRYIRKIEPTESVPTRCIEVDSPDHLYLAGKGLIPSHNTSFLPLWLWREIQQCGPGDYMAVTSTFPLLQLKLLPSFLDIFEHTLHLGTYRAGDRVFEYRRQKTRVMFGSASHPESLESATAKAAILDEVGQDAFKLQSWEAVQRRLSLHQGRVLAGTTIYNLGWMKFEIYDPWLAGDPDIAIIQFPSIQNPAFPKAEFERAKAKFAAWKFRMFYLGQFDQPPGLIYSDYADTYREDGGNLVHPFDLPPAWPRYVGVDPGAVNTATVWLAHDPAADVYYVYHETLAGGKTTAEHAAGALAQARGTNMQQWFLGAKSEEQQRMDWRAAGVLGLPPPITDVEAGIDRVTELCKTRRLFVFDTCAGLRDELGMYSRVVGEDGQPTEKIKDKGNYHILDALRYVVVGLSSAPPAGDVINDIPTDVYKSERRSIWQ